MRRAIVALHGSAWVYNRQTRELTEEMALEDIFRAPWGFVFLSQPWFGSFEFGYYRNEGRGTLAVSKCFIFVAVIRTNIVVAFKSEALDRALYSEGRHMAVKPPNLTLDHQVDMVAIWSSVIIGPTVTMVTI